MRSAGSSLSFNALPGTEVNVRLKINVVEVINVECSESLYFHHYLFRTCMKQRGLCVNQNYSDKNENLYSSAHWTKQKFDIKGASDFQLLLFHFFLSRSRTLLGTTLIKGKGQYAWSLWFTSPNQHPKAANNEISDSSLQIFVKIVFARHNMVSVSNAESRANIELYFNNAGNKESYCRFLK